MKTFVGDRTVGCFDSMLLHRYHYGSIIFPLYRILSCFWRVNNGDDDFHNSKGCYKIHIFDYADDVIDVFASHHHAVAAVHSRVDYKTEEWRQFYDSLRFVFSIELDMANCDIIQAVSKETLDQHMFNAMRKAEIDMVRENGEVDFMNEYEPERNFKLKPGAGEEFTLKTSSILLDYQKKFNKHGELSLRFLSGALDAKSLRG